MGIQNQLIRQALLGIKQKKTGEIIEKQNKDVTKSNLNDVKGLGNATIKILFDNNITTQEELKDASEDELSKIVRNPLTRKSILNFINT